MPLIQVPLADGANAVEQAVARIEAEGGTVIAVTVVLGTVLVTYSAKKPRATKVETR